MYLAARMPRRSATLLGGLAELPSLVAKRGDVSEKRRRVATVSMASSKPGAPASASATFAACAIKSNGDLPASMGVVRSVTSPHPTRIGVESSNLPLAGVTAVDLGLV